MRARTADSRSRARARAAPTSAARRASGLRLRSRMPRSVALRRRRDAFGADQPLEVGVAVSRLQPGDFRDRLGLHVVAAVARLAALPVRDVGVRLALARAHRRAVDGFLKSRGQLHADGVAALPARRPARARRARR